MEGKIRVYQIARTKQGEGEYVGKDVVLVRLVGCNLRCEWCDTKYTWDMRNGEDRSAKQILKAVIAVSSERKIYGKIRNINTVLITGGEPGIYYMNEEFKELLELLDRFGYDVHIETNGTIVMPVELMKHVRFISISPKITLYPQLYEPELVRKWIDTFKQLKAVVEEENNKFKMNRKAVDRIWKFVVGSMEDMYRVGGFLADIEKFVGEMRDEKIYLMPLTVVGSDYDGQLKFLEQNLDILKDIGFKNVFVSERRQVKEGWKV